MSAMMEMEILVSGTEVETNSSDWDGGRSSNGRDGKSSNLATWIEVVT